MTEAELTVEIEKMIHNRLVDIATDEIGTGLCVIVAHARVRLHLEGRDLVTFVHRVIAGLVAGGATPADDRLFSADNPQGLAHFGADTPREVADGIVAAWVAAGMPNPEWGDWRFNSPKNRAWLDAAAAT